MYATAETTRSLLHRVVPRSCCVRRCRVATVPIDVSPARVWTCPRFHVYMRGHAKFFVTLSGRSLAGRAVPRQDQTTELAHPCYRARLEDGWEYNFVPNPPLCGSTMSGR